MNENERVVRVGIDIEELAGELRHGKGDRCLDFETGAIVRAEDCPEQATGEGRPALRQGKRFIRIPTFDDMCRADKERLDEMDWGDYEDATELLPEDPEAEEVRRALEPLFDAEDPDYREASEQLNGDVAAEGVALRWVASLRPSFAVGWLHEGIGITFVYDPERGGWVDV
jgi:hypothetical protein